MTYRRLLRQPRGFAVEIDRVLRVVDTEDACAQEEGAALELLNFYVVDPITGQGGLRTRPGYALMGTQLAAAAVQAHGQFTTLTGTEYTWAIVNGAIFTYNWGTEAWSEVVSSAAITTGGATLAASGRVYAVVFVDKLVISDGVNKPFTWDGMSGSGGITLLSNAPVFYGQPVVHYAKLVGIKQAERNAIVWSEENQPNTGYEAGGFNNAWALAQTEQEALYALMPTNEALYYWRDASIGAVWGRVTPEFQTTGTNEAVSETVGTTSPGSICKYENWIWFMDQNGRPRRFQQGTKGIADRQWQDAANALSFVALAALDTVHGVFNPLYRYVQFVVEQSGSPAPDYVLNFSAEAGSFQGTWTGIEASSYAVVKNGTGRFRIASGDASGYMHVHGAPDDAVWDDAPAGVATAIAHAYETRPLAYHSRQTRLFDRADLDLALITKLTNFSVFMRVPNQAEAQAIGSFSLGQSVWGTMVWGTDPWSDAPPAFRVAVGLDAQGRWGALRIVHEEATEAFGLYCASVEGVIWDSEVKTA
jgi:hypothetical protein